MTVKVSKPRITRNYLNKINHANKYKSDIVTKKISTTSISNEAIVQINNDDIIEIFKNKYNIISDLIFELYNITLPKINYVENKILIKVLMNTIFENKEKSEKYEKNKYEELKNLIGNIIEFPLYEIYRDYHIEVQKLIDAEFHLEKYKNNNIKNVLSVIPYKKNINQGIKYGVIFGVIFNIILFSYLIYYKKIKYEDIYTIILQYIKYYNIDCYITNTYTFIKIKVLDNIITMSIPIINFIDNLIISYQLY